MKSIVKNASLSLIIAAVVIALLMSSCANREVVDACLKGTQFGFWSGLWHGIIAPVDFVLMFWRDDITIYAQNNNGMWYAFGFLLGSGGWGFMSSRGARRARRNRE